MRNSTTTLGDKTVHISLPLVPPSLLAYLQGPTWIAKRVEVAPGVVDMQIVCVTMDMARFLGYTEAMSLVGQYLSLLHALEDVQTSRLHCIVRALGRIETAPWDYVAHMSHATGRFLRVSEACYRLPAHS